MYENRGLPTWLVFLVSVALVLGLYYLWVGLQTYLGTGGQGVEGATQQAIIISTTQAVQQSTEAVPTRTLFPTFTPVPPCQDWTVEVASAIVRRAPNTNAAIVETFTEGNLVCVIEPVTGTEWHLIDTNPATRRIEEGYMHDDIIEPLQPTLTPSITPTPLPTVTRVSTATPVNSAPTLPVSATIPSPATP